MPTQKHTIEKVVPLPRRKVWELLSHTDHLNRVIGLFPIRSSQYIIQGTDFFQELMAKALGVMPMRWREHPFEWVKYERYSVLREYEGGPLRRFFGGMELEDAQELLPDGGPATKVRLFAEFTPANMLGLAAIPVVGVKSMRQTMVYLLKAVRLESQKKGHLLPETKAAFPIHPQELERLMKDLSLSGVEERLVERLREHLITSGDDGVVDMQPYKLAGLWGTKREETLRMFLYATKLGITNLRWHLICPNCRVSKTGEDSLLHINPRFHCDFCGIGYEANFDRYVELCFTVHPGLRRAYKQVFCVGGPMITPHIHTQIKLPAGGEARLVYPASEEEMRLRVLRANRMVKLVRGAAAVPSAAELVYYEGGWSYAEHPEPAPGTPLRIVNRTRESIYVALEKAEWDQDTVTAAKVTTMHEFRTLFSSEVLSPGQQVGVESVTLLFSDLLGSTAFYEHVGDAHAYGQVRRHFDFMIEHVRQHQGTLVKTIGDAVMAVFEYPENAVKAALEIQSDAAQLHLGNQSGLSTPLLIKIGLYHGPAIVVNSNGILDYFGRTVNLAARAQALSKGDDIITSRECTERSEMKELIFRYGVETEFFEQKLKGIDGVMELARLRLIQRGESDKYVHEKL